MGPASCSCCVVYTFLAVSSFFVDFRWLFVSDFQPKTSYRILKIIVITWLWSLLNRSERVGSWVRTGEYGNCQWLSLVTSVGEGYERMHTVRALAPERFYLCKAVQAWCCCSVWGLIQLSLPCYGPESLTLFLSTLFGKRGIFTRSHVLWVFFPLSFCITMIFLAKDSVPPYTQGRHWKHQQNRSYC